MLGEFIFGIPLWCVSKRFCRLYIQDMKTKNDAAFYEIRIKGLLGQNTLIWFEDFAVEYSEDGETILNGPIVDQAAMYGILNRISELGLTLTLFRKIGNRE